MSENFSPHKAERTESDFFEKMWQNPIINSLPNHLKQFIVDQNYVAYSSQDHSVWRYVLRQNYRFLIDHAHEIYFEGLEKTGLKVESIPGIEDMNEILSKIGWAAVSVDGFIPPAAFMEFQAHRVLVIAADMRQIHHIEYTPSPDIIHEAAGHAPVIADSEYAEYLRRFGAIGAKAMSSKKDYELYEAIRKLSILKEARDADENEIKKAKEDVLFKQKNLGDPSEMALLSRLHWWTVEYGLVGTLDQPKIYGAGLLSSIGEAANCLSPKVKKLSYDINAEDVAFDITTMQPQLFVTPDFTHLINVLEQFADNMAFRRGGLEGINKAIECANSSTCVFSSGLQLSGQVTDVSCDDNNSPIYLKTIGKSNLSYNSKELVNHGIEYHKDGFGSPIGKLKDSGQLIEDMNDDELRVLGIELNKECKLNFESSVIVNGLLKNIERRDGKIILITFDNCSVKLNDTVLFDPAWGIYDMAVGEKIISVFSGAADKDAFDQPSSVSKTRVIKYSYDKKTESMFEIYQSLRDFRAGKIKKLDFESIWNDLKENYSEDWLLHVELLEILVDTGEQPEIADEVKDNLEQWAKKDQGLNKLIEDGIFLAYHPNKYKYSWGM